MKRNLPVWEWLKPDRIPLKKKWRELIVNEVKSNKKASK